MSKYGYRLEGVRFERGGQSCNWVSIIAWLDQRHNWHKFASFKLADPVFDKLYKFPPAEFDSIKSLNSDYVHFYSDCINDGYTSSVPIGVAFKDCAELLTWIHNERSLMSDEWADIINHHRLDVVKYVLAIEGVTTSHGPQKSLSVLPPMIGSW
jgi:hypothetical protein